MTYEIRFVAKGVPDTIIATTTDLEAAKKQAAEFSYRFGRAVVVVPKTQG